MFVGTSKMLALTGGKSTILEIMTKKEFAGMTVNERLYTSGLSKEFYKAVEEKNITKVIDILKEVDLNEISIEPILKSLGLKES